MAGPAKPLLIYDGDCGFCVRRVEGLRRLTGEALDFASSQAVGARHPEVPQETFRRTVVLVQPGRDYLTGAEAVFTARALGGRRGLLKLYRVCAPFRWFAEAGYRFIAAQRAFFSRWEQRLGRR